MYIYLYVNPNVSVCVYIYKHTCLWLPLGSEIIVQHEALK